MTLHYKLWKFFNDFKFYIIWFFENKLTKNKILFMNKKILICTGGTGGHVIPAVNFGNFLINKGFECCLILDQRGNKFSKNFNGKIFIIRSSHLSGNIFLINLIL